ncbi:hypothetical protein BgAZ_300770 [Babesia gibsoni]|uniref:RecA family profile 1 domain-containing protein n=1 Tax=Babesia gibsoni TaxID=33632 RepID=A0AAD8LHZ6_BABGI|nr:hypothetical protein BgAZ_300770 [Babesia gibsoni]
MSTTPSSVRSLQEIWETADVSHTPRPLEFGVSEIDAAFSGGLSCGKLYEVYGEPGAGKTQLALTLVAQKLISIHLNKGDEIIIYLHSTGTFPIERLCEVIDGKLRAQQYESNVDSSLIRAILRNLRIDKVVDPPGLISKLVNFQSNVKDATKVSDQPPACISSQVAFLLKRLAFQMQMSVLVVNEVSGTPENNVMGVRPVAAISTTLNNASRSKPALGDTWTQSLNCRVAMYHTKNIITTRRFIQIAFCANAPSSDPIPIVINNRGVDTGTSDHAR